MLARKDEVVKSLTDGVKFLFRKNKITASYGAGRLTSPTTVGVRADDGTETPLEAATSSLRPAAPRSTCRSCRSTARTSSARPRR